MKSTRRGAIRLVGLAALVVGVLGIATAAGFVVADDDPTGETVLSDVEQQYRTADSVVVDAAVTIEDDDAVWEFSVDLVATADDQLRLNVSDDGGYLLAGYDGHTSWLSSSELASPLVVSDTSALGNASFVGTNGTVSMAGLDALVSAMDANLSWNGSLDNASLERFRDAINESDLLEGWNESEPLQKWNESEFSDVWNESDFLEDWNASEFSARNWTHALTEGDWNLENVSVDPGDWSVSTLLAETNLTAERVETTTLDGQAVYVVAVSAPECDGELTLWVRTDDAAVAKQRLTTSNAIVTVEMETRFDVSLAESTFQPPMESTDFGSEMTVDSLADLRASAATSLAVPGADWTFERGTALERPVSVTVSEYAADGATVTIVQSGSSARSEFTSDGRTVDVGDRTVTVTEFSGEQAAIPWLSAGDGTLVQWTENDQTVVVAGDLDESALLEVVETIEFEASDA